MYKKTIFTLQIAENVIKVISQCSIEQVSFELISAATNISVSTIIDNFESLNNLIAFCLTLSFDSLARNLSIDVEKIPYKMNSIEAFWITLVEFNTIYSYKGRLIAAYLKAPASYPLVNVKYCLAKSINYKFEKTDHILKQYNGDIRFIAFAYLFQMASKVSIDIPNSIEKYGQDFVSDFYNKHIAEGLIRFTKLPIS
ncbi:hypothetical protein [Pedobacter cryoconitis]|nr:hypothetical protein [Pedobacter cryoconitis]